MLLGASYAVGWVSLVFADLRNVLLRTVSLTVSIALCVLFLSAIAKGKNWARITVAVFVAINLVVGVAVLLARVSGATTVGLSIRLLLQGPALTLLFSGRGASWFRPRAASRQTVG